MRGILLALAAALLFLGTAHAYSDRSGTLTSWGERGILVEDYGRTISIDLWNPTTSAYTFFGVSGTTASWAPSENKFALMSSVQNADYSRWLPALCVYDTGTNQEQVIKVFDYVASYSYSWVDDSQILYGFSDSNQYGFGIIGLDGTDTVLESNPTSVNSGHGMEFKSVVWDSMGIYYTSLDFSGVEPVSDIWLRSNNGEFAKMLTGQSPGTKLFGIQNGYLYYGFNGSVPLADVSPEMGDFYPDYYTHGLWAMSLITHQTSLVSAGRGQIGGISPDGQKLFLYGINHNSLFPRSYYIYGYTEIVPEPSTIAVLSTGLVGALSLYRRRRY